MDHLPYPEDPALPPLEIPYICENIKKYDGRDYFRFPIRSQWSQDVEYWHECSADDAAARAQSWLYFGLLEVCLGDKFDLGGFTRVCSRSGNRVITLANLESLIPEHDRIRLKEAIRPSPIPDAQGADAKSSLVDSWLVTLCLSVRNLARPLQGMSRLANTIFISIEVLIWSLLGISGYSIRLSYDLPSGATNDTLKDRMIGTGWCPFWIEEYTSSCPAVFLYYLGALKGASQPEWHCGCTIEKCIGRHIDPYDYVTKHVTEDCQCSFAGPDMGMVALILQDHGTPVVELAETTDGYVEINTFRAMFERPYIAVSHVWADGLGNPESNSLPQCQLRQLLKALRICQQKELENWLDGPPDGALDRWMYRNIPRYGFSKYLWIDTFCIPVKRSQDHLRRLAVDRIALTYAAATHVLVLDKVVQHTRFEELSDAEVAARLSTCPWMSRCWTFQEACLAKSYYFLLSDNLVHPKAWNIIDENGYECSTDPPDRCKTRIEKVFKADALYRLVGSMPDVVKHNSSFDPLPRVQYFAKVWTELALRNTTKAEDTHIILATMLGLSAEEILSIPPDGRMQAILGSQDMLPLSMLLFRWQEGIESHPEHKWVPKYPAGPLNQDFGLLAWREEESGLAFCPRETNSCVFLVETLVPQLNVRLQGSVSEGQTAALAHTRRDFWIWHEPRSDPAVPSETGYYCYLLHGCLNAISNAQYHGPGARFAVSTVSATGSLCLKFDRCLAFTCYRSEMLQRLDLAKSEHEPTVHAVGIFSDVQCLLTCGKLFIPQNSRNNSTAD